MLLTVTSTAPQATDLGFLLHKHPDRVQSFELPVGTAHVFYPEATPERCTAALLLEVDPVALVRGRASTQDQYVNDRPYAASSLLAVALGKVFSTARTGRCATRPDLEGVPLPLTIHVPAVPCAEGADLVERLFAPLGWQVDASVPPLDPQVPAWGDAPYVDLTLVGTMALDAALTHLYVLLPVLDDDKHYWVGADEVDKLVRAGTGWLADHPERELVTRRYLAHQRSYVEDATSRLVALDDVEAPLTEPVARPSLARARREAVALALRDIGARRVVDLGCGEGALLRELVTDPSFTELVGVDVAARELDRAARWVDRLPDQQRTRVTLRQSSATYRDPAIAGFDALVLMEVVEHLDPERLPALESTVFAHARPGAVVVTTPNAEFNVLYERLQPGGMRHPDHRFEWTRAQLAAWATDVAQRHGYDVAFRDVGPADEVHGPATQLALFTVAEVAR
ncbi:MAG: 3' terminal RNA ribose 2'-O-methyltransferase Hen1 [Brevundimonas sp.]